MSNGTDQQMCCAAGICCDRPKQIAALADRLLQNDGSLSKGQATEAATYMADHFTILPESWGFGQVVRKIQAHPYA